MKTYQEAAHQPLFPPELATHLVKLASIRPHKSKYWLNSPDKKKDPEQYQKDVQSVCDVYAEALELQEQGGHVVSCDEKTGIQALERAYETKPVRPGLVERREFE